MKAERRWTPKTLQQRLTLTITLVTGGQAMIGGAVFSATESSAMLEQLDESLASHARSEELSIYDRPDHVAHLHDTPLLVKGAPNTSEKYAALYDGRGQVLAYTRALAGAVPDFNRIPHGGTFDLVVRGRQLRVVMHPTGTETATRWLLLAAPRDEFDEALREHAWATGGVLVLAVVLASVASWFLSRWLAGDLASIARTARQVASGDLHARVGSVGGVHEMQQIAHDLDEMIARLEAMVATQRRFVSDAAHELRSPLTSLRGELELALRKPRSAEEYRDALSRAREDVLHLSTLADDLLRLARARTRTQGATPTLVSELWASLIEEFRARAAPKKVEVTFDGDATVMMSRLHLERVLRNLVENAIKFAPEGSQVTVTARTLADDVEIAVGDEGDGVPLQQAERIFEPFVRLDSSRQREGGAGLGLAIARELARANNGDVVLDVDHKGPGARFLLLAKAS